MFQYYTYNLYMNIIIVGNIAAGKTTLVNSLNNVIKDSYVIKEKFEDNAYLCKFYESGCKN